MLQFDRFYGSTFSQFHLEQSNAFGSDPQHYQRRKKKQSNVQISTVTLKYNRPLISVSGAGFFFFTRHRLRILDICYVLARKKCKLQEQLRKKQKNYINDGIGIVFNIQQCFNVLRYRISYK